VLLRAAAAAGRAGRGVTRHGEEAYVHAGGSTASPRPRSRSPATRTRRDWPPQIERQFGHNRVDSKGRPTQLLAADARGSARAEPGSRRYCRPRTRRGRNWLSWRFSCTFGHAAAQGGCVCVARMRRFERRHRGEPTCD
jgi:hypothetical protein